MIICPKCKSEKVNRIYCEFKAYEIALGVLIAFLSYKNLFSFMPAYLKEIFVNGFVGFILFIRVILPVLTNWRLPKYRCTACKHEFKTQK